MGNDLPQAFLESLKEKSVILDSVQTQEGKNTSYKLYYNKENQRTLSLKEKGFSITADYVIKHILK